MATVFKRAGRWYIRYRDHSGKDLRKRVPAKTKREAEAILAQIIGALSDGSYEIKHRQRGVKFFEICQDFLAYGQAHKRSWRRDMDSINHLKQFFGDCLATEIKPANIEEYMLHRKNSLTPKGKHPAPATINLELACMRTVYNRAIKNTKLENNPVKHVKFLKVDNKRNRVLAREEFENLLRVSPEHLKPILIAAYETGMRAGEIFNLEWHQIDLEKGFIKLRPEQTKTSEGRKIPISSVLSQTLSEMKPKTGYVFIYNGHSIGSVKNAFTNACKKAGIEGFRFHDFRHTFVTNMRKAGKQDRVIMAITGHKTLAMLTRYDTVDEEDLLRAVA